MSCSSNQIVDELRQLNVDLDAALAKTDGEITEDIEIIVNKIDNLQTDASTKLDGIERMIIKFKEHIVKHEAIAKHYQKIADTQTSRAKNVQKKI